MVTAEAAYCTACGGYVFVAPDGGCEHGHLRSSLHAVYHAEIDKRTGLPKPPRPGVTSVAAPVAPIAVQTQLPSALHTPTAAIGIPMHHDVARAVIWPAAFNGLADGTIARLLNPPRGKHSATPGAPRRGRGRHSAVIVRDRRRTVIGTMLVAGSLAAAIGGMASLL